MKLLRFAVLTCTPRPNPWEPFGVKCGDIAVGMGVVPSPPAAKDELLAILRAETSLNELPQRDNDGYITFPDTSRRSCEVAIEFVANLIAVAGRCKRSISSPTPPAALVAEVEAEQKFLDDSTGLRLTPVSHEGAKPNITINEDLVAALCDRQDGLSLIAEAFSYTQALGKYRDFVRLLELAFSMPMTQLEKKLTTFLRGAHLGYERSEIGKWISLRHGASHADMRKADSIVLESDVSPIIMRMEQATMDVLFNKNDWHNRSTDRRDLFRPNVATTSPSGDLRLVRGQNTHFIAQIFDEFGAYPYYMKNILSPRPEWWWKTVPAPLICGKMELTD